MSLANFAFSGTIKKNPEKRFTPTNIAVANLTVEVSYMQRGQNLSAQQIRVNAWRDLAEFCEQKLKAGDKVLITGRAMINAYTTNDGKKKRALEVDANSIVLLKDVLSIQPTPGSEAELENITSAKNQMPEQASNFDEIISNTEEIPF